VGYEPLAVKVISDAVVLTLEPSRLRYLDIAARDQPHAADDCLQAFGGPAV